MKIIATISKYSYGADKIEEIIRAGAEVLRYNFSHGTPEELEQKIRTARYVIEKLGMRRKVKILADLPGAKIRIGEVVPTDRAVEVGEEVIFSSRKEVPEGILVGVPNVGMLVRVGQQFTLADGEIGFEVAQIIDEETFVSRALNARVIPSLKGINIGQIIDDLDHLTPHTRAHIDKLRAISPEWVAFSFVNSAVGLKKAKHLVTQVLGYCPTVVSKIESERGVANIEEIVNASDMVMVARGDLGLNCPIEMLGVYQKRIIAAAKRAGKQAIVATQILDSILDRHIPSRSDVLDLTNCVLDGADAIMLARETGMSLTPGRSVATARKIIDAVLANV